MIFDSGITIVHVVIMLALCFFALWQAGWIRIVLSLGIIIWGVWALQYDVKIAGTLLGLGTLLFFMGIMAKISQSRADTQGG